MIFYSKHSRKLSGASLALLIACALGAITTQSNAAVLFMETFEGITSGFGGSDPTNPGLPLVSEGAAETWYGGTFEMATNGALSDASLTNGYDLGVQDIGGGTNSTNTGKADDDRGLIFKVNTTGYTNVKLMFDWRNFGGNGTYDATNNPDPDRFVVAYFVGDLGLNNTTRYGDFRDEDQGGGNGNELSSTGGADRAVDYSHWIELQRSFNTSWTTGVMYNLPSNAMVWVAFWSDSNEGEYIKVDNVKVTGDPTTVVPLPVAAYPGFALLGLIGAARYTRRRRQIG